MKKIIFLLMFTSISLQINAQTNSKAQTDSIVECFGNMPQLSAEPEVLDWDSFPGITRRWGEKDYGRGQRIQIIGVNEGERDSVRTITYYWNNYEGTYKEYDAKGMLIKDYHSLSHDAYGREYINPYIYIYKEFYPNSMIKEKKIYTVWDFNIGKEYRYDENGNLQKTIDHDKGYDFTAEDIINYCLRNKIDVCKKPVKGSEVRPTKIGKSEDKQQWWIEYEIIPSNRTFNEKIRFLIYLDGKTGQVVEWTAVPFNTWED